MVKIINFFKVIHQRFNIVNLQYLMIILKRQSTLSFNRVNLMLEPLKIYSYISSSGYLDNLELLDFLFKN